MKVKKDIDDGDLALLTILTDPVLFGEFIRSDSKTVYKYDNYQKIVLNNYSPFACLCSGRAVGKTITLETILIHDAVSCRYEKSPENEILFVVSNRAQLDPVFLRISRMFRSNFFLKSFVDGINSSMHEIKLVNGALIRCRIAGASGDTNIIGLHVSKIVGDEFQVFPYVAWNSLLQCLHRHDKSGRELQLGEYQLMISGVPNGVREKNVLYEADQLDERFFRHHISRLESPRYTEDQLQRDLKQYGGVNGDDFVHLVLGEHGAPSFRVFDRSQMKIESYTVKVSVMNEISLEQARGDWSQLLNIPEPPASYEHIALGCDLGFSPDPTELIVLYSTKAKDNTEIWRELARIELRRITYPKQAKIIDWLDNIYNFNMITVDLGSNGLSVYQILMGEEFKHKKYDKRLIGVDFNSSIIVGRKDDEDIKERVKRYTITKLQEWIQADHSFILSEQDSEIIEELERVGFTRDLSGRPNYFVYTANGGQRGDDHNLSALLTWVYGVWLGNYSDNIKHSTYKDLARPGWYIPNTKRL